MNVATRAAAAATDVNAPACATLRRDVPLLERVLTIGQPLVFGVAVILSRYLSFPTTVDSILRPVVVVLGLAAVSLVLARITTRNWTWTAILASLVVLFLLREAIPAGILAAVAIWWLLVAALRRIQGRRPPPERVPRFVARAMGIYSVVLLAAMAVSAGAAATFRPAVELPGYSTTGTGGPSIYVLLLDGYPRADTLQRTFRFDNSPFQDALAEAGFDVAQDARTNYNKTWLTLASALNGAYVADILEPQEIPANEADQIRWLHTLIDEASILEVLRARGYAIRTIPPPFSSAALTSADQVLDEGHLNEFEAKVLWSSPVLQPFSGSLTDFLLAGQEARVTEGLSAMVGLAEAHDQPQFALAHIHSPHPPFVLGNAEEAVQTLECFPSECTLWHSTIEGLNIPFEAYRRGLAEQLPALNELVLDSVRRIVAADPEAVVLILSDHGTRYSLADPDEHFRSFFAARTPGRAEVFPDDISTVNVLRLLFAEYFGTDTPALPYRAWYGAWNEYLRLSPYTPR